MNDIDNTNKNCGTAEAFEELTFEQAASKLEEIVEKLDSGETPLGETVKLYEQGIALSDYCMTGFNSLGVSNEIVDERGEISFEKGILLVIESRDDESA